MASTTTTAAVTLAPVTNGETLIATTGIADVSLDGAIITVGFYIDLVMGTAGTAWTVRIRRGATLAGSLLLASPPLTLAAAASGSYGGLFTDLNPGIIAQAQYSITVQQTAATGNGTITNVALAAFIF